MKKFWVTICMAFASLIALFSLAACADYSEVAGTYEMTSISGTINGVAVNKDMYEYFRIILEKNGNGTVQSKGTGVGTAAYEAKGTFTYSAEEGKIRLTTKNGSASVTEEYDYVDGVITYKVDAQGMKFTVKFTLVVETETD